MFRRVVVLLSGICLLTALVAQAAQIECAAIVAQAMSLIDANCAATGRNQACHGYLRVEASPRPTISDFSFELGQIANVEDISSLRTTAFDQSSGEWGVAFLRLQANLPNELPGANVTLLLMGDARLDDASEEGQAPMQAFQLRSGLSGATCSDAPADGLLIQTPHGAGRVNLTVNGADVSLGSTVFFEARPGETMTVSTLEGSAVVTAKDESQTALPGQQVSVPMSLSMRPAGAPSAPQAYNVAAMRNLPLALFERQVMLVDESDEDVPPPCDCPPDQTVSSDPVVFESPVAVPTPVPMNMTVGETSNCDPGEGVNCPPSSPAEGDIVQGSDPPPATPEGAAGSQPGNCGNGSGQGSGQDCPPSSPAGGNNPGQGSGRGQSGGNNSVDADDSD